MGLTSIPGWNDDDGCGAAEEEKKERRQRAMHGTPWWGGEWKNLVPTSESIQLSIHKKNKMGSLMEDRWWWWCWWWGWMIKLIQNSVTTNLVWSRSCSCWNLGRDPNILSIVLLLKLLIGTWKFTKTSVWLCARVTKHAFNQPPTSAQLTLNNNWHHES